jgi:hypothetical protein
MSYRYISNNNRVVTSNQKRLTITNLFDNIYCQPTCLQILMQKTHLRNNLHFSLQYFYSWWLIMAYTSRNMTHAGSLAINVV